MLFVGSSAMTLLYISLPETIVTSRPAMYALLGLAALVGGVAYVLPWNRWHPRTTLILLPIALTVIAVGNYLGAVQAFAFPIFFVVAFAWVGIAHPRWTSVWLVAPATVAYVTPILLRPEPLAIDASSAVITMPVCVLVAETLAAISHSERQSRALAEALSDTAAALAVSLDKDAVLQVLVEEARRATGSQHAVLFEGDAESLTVNGVYTSGIDEPFASMYSKLIGSSYAGFAGVRALADASGPVLVHDTSETDGYPKELIEPFGVKSFLGLPIQVDGRGVGILTCGESASTRRYTDSEVALVSSLAMHAGLTIRNALRYDSSLKSAMRDTLTGLGNRGAFEARVEAEIGGSRPGDGEFSVVALDIDGFKRVNDRYGHHEGDVALHHLGRVLEEGCRASDGAFRIGGDEFALVLPQTSSPDAMRLAERLLETIRASRIGADSTPVTVSMGVATIPDHGADFAEAFARADAALYAVKREGGDGVAPACDETVHPRVRPPGM